MKSKASEHRPKGGKGDSEDGNVPEPGQPENRQSGRGHPWQNRERRYYKER